MRLNFMVKKTLQAYWRLTRSLTMGAQGVILDDRDRVLLIRHTYQQGWHFPGGGVERNETVIAALQRELDEEVGIELTASPHMFGIYPNFESFPSDHIVLFVVRRWHRAREPKPNREIADQGFFSLDRLPTGTIAPVKRRLAEIFEARQPSNDW